MIASEKKIGRATCFAAATIARVRHRRGPRGRLSRASV